jgi:hypothetical protein
LKFLLKKFFSFPQGTAIGEFALSVLLSFSYFFILSVILSVTFSLTAINLAIALILPIIAIDLASVLQNWQTSSRTLKQSYRYDQLIVIPIIGIGILLALLFRSNFVWPSMPGWDLYAYLGGSNWIYANHGTVNLLPASVGIVMPTAYFFQDLIASLSYVVGANPYSIFWASSFIVIPLFGVLIYETSLSFTKKCSIAFFASTIALLIPGSETFLGPQYLFPSTLSMLIFLLILNFIIGFEDFTRFYISLLLVFLFLFYVVYYFPIVVTLPLFLVLVITKRFRGRWSRNRLALISCSIFVVMIALSWTGSYLLTPGTFPAVQKIGMITDVYPIIFIVLFFAGCCIVLLKYLKAAEVESSFIAIYAISLLIVYFLPPFSSIRVEIFFRCFFAIIAAIPFSTLLEMLFSKYKAQKTNGHLYKSIFKSRFGKLIVIFSCLFIILTLALSLPNFLSYATAVPHDSNISKDEYLSAKWIQQNTPPNTYVITDPSTGYVLRGLTIRNSSTSFIINGHTPSPDEFANLTSVLYNYFTDDNVSNLSLYYNELPKQADVIVITTRTSAWINSQSMYAVYPAPTGNQLLPFDGIAKFSSNSFKLVASWNTVSIYEPINTNLDSNGTK